MSVTLAVSDSGDGTGGAATISGVASGASTAIYYAAWTGTEGALTGTLAGTVTGNTTLAVNPGSGQYQWWALSTLTGTTTLSNIVFQSLTDTDEVAIHYAILGAVKTRIASLGLSGLTTDRIYKKWMPRALESVETVPCVFVSPASAESYPGMLNNQDDVGYPVLVAVVDRLQGDSAANMNRDLLWRQKIQAAFRYQRLPGVPSVINCDIRPGLIIDDGAYQKNYLASGILFMFISRQGRGLT